MLQLTGSQVSWLAADAVALLAAGAFLFAGVVLLRPFLRETGLSHPWWTALALVFRCLPGALLLFVAYSFASRAVDDLTGARRQVEEGGLHGAYATFTIGTAP